MRTAFTAIFLAVLSVLGAVVSPWAAAAAECPSRAATLMAMGLRIGSDCGTPSSTSCGDSCGSTQYAQPASASCCCGTPAVVAEPSCCGTQPLPAGSSGAVGAAASGCESPRPGCSEGVNAPVRGCQGCRASALSALAAIEGTTRSRLSNETGKEPARVVTAAHLPPARQWHAESVQTERALDNSRRRALLCIRTI